MSLLSWLVPVALGMGLVGLIAFLWSMRSGQLEDLDGAAERVLLYEADDAPLRMETTAIALTLRRHGANDARAYRQEVRLGGSAGVRFWRGRNDCEHDRFGSRIDDCARAVFLRPQQRGQLRPDVRDATTWPLQPAWPAVLCGRLSLECLLCHLLKWTEKHRTLAYGS